MVANRCSSLVELFEPRTMHSPSTASFDWDGGLRTQCLMYRLICFKPRRLDYCHINPLYFTMLGFQRLSMRNANMLRILMMLCGSINPHFN